MKTTTPSPSKVEAVQAPQDNATPSSQSNPAKPTIEKIQEIFDKTVDKLAADELDARDLKILHSILQESKESAEPVITSEDARVAFAQFFGKEESNETPA
jgi:hypothetical protein